MDFSPPNFFGQIAEFHLFELFCGKTCSTEKLTYRKYVYYIFLRIRRYLCIYRYFYNFVCVCVYIWKIGTSFCNEIKICKRLVVEDDFLLT